MEDSNLPDRKDAPEANTALARVSSQLKKMGETEREVIALLPSMSWRQLLTTRSKAQILYTVGWRVEIACDAEIWDRHDKATSGRGNVDTEGRGIMAAVNRRSKEIGCGASTIRANARLHKRFKKVMSTHHNLDDKGFYQAAEAADDPIAAVKHFAKEKLANPLYRPADAWRWVRKRKARDIGESVDDTLVLKDETVRDWLLNYKARREDDLATAPVPFLKDMVRAHSRHAGEQLGRTIAGDCEEIMTAIEECGGLSFQGIETWLYAHCYFISEANLEDRIAYMEFDKWIVEDSAGEEGKLDESRGTQATFYVPYYAKRKKRESQRDDQGDEEAA